MCISAPFAFSKSTSSSLFLTTDSAADPKANVKWGARIIPGYEGQLEIVAIVTGVSGSSILGKFEDKKRSSTYADIEMI